MCEREIISDRKLGRYEENKIAEKTDAMRETKHIIRTENKRHT